MNGAEMEQIGRGTGLIMRKLIRENFRFSVQMVLMINEPFDSYREHLLSVDPVSELR